LLTFMALLQTCRSRYDLIRPFHALPSGQRYDNP
jgi:hypothetical protein